MKVHLKQKDAGKLLPTDIVFQTVFWGDVKSRLGWKPLAFDFTSSGPYGDVLVLTKTLLPGLSVAYVPQGPEFGPEPDRYGLFLESLSEGISAHLDPSVTFIRYDLPWVSQYAADTANGSSSRVQSFNRPEARLQELRMNFGTRSWNLQKAAVDLTFADRVVVDLGRSEEEMLRTMKPKTRYNIGLARRKEIEVFLASSDHLPAFYELYRQTAERNRFRICEYRHFSLLFSADSSHPDSTEILFLLARHGRDLLAGAIVAISARTATYLFGASSNEKRNLMASYAIQWKAMQIARAKGCLHYDLGAVSPAKDPEHPYFGLYRFKTGFGGRIIHQSGSWDYPLDKGGYMLFRNSENMDGILRIE
ncbi:MAG: peptidoglycan bridge formation protein FemAB [Deltaproteobacteria bacterium HGW-Deltaproteobacteria-15]|jgi:lipid II:glycine glycyltransferase (peptidoglycan interpeptide bridge formation enzyme)|nr:MAG: peptidoglycan bridge formation protein FemAB [Deltaproteobacteria bacterium HGW-Deltaproteobacteria-15]